jgi:membrane-associated protease RseP (regulator of RpoE activity)
MTPGDKVELAVSRNGDLSNMEATLDAQPGRQPQRRGYRGTEDENEAWMGVVLSEGREGGAPGAEVTHVYPGGPASDAGIRDGDRIVSVNGNEVPSADQLVAQIQQHQPGDQITLEVVRSGRQQPITLQITAANRSDFLPSGERSPGQYNPIFELPEHVMRLEHDRRMAENDERIEGLLLQVLREIRDLQRDVNALKSDGRASDPSAQTQTSTTGLPSEDERQAAE